MIGLFEWLKRNYSIFLLFLVSALAYLPHISDFGYFRDDWYLMYSANALGVKTFSGIFAIDRPVRAVLMAILFSWFRMDPLGYNLMAYMVRVLGALSFHWTLKMLWPKQSLFTTIAAVLFLVYPGFLSMPNAIDYQEKYVGLFLGQMSIALSIKSVSASNRTRIFLWPLTVLTAALYPAFVEYYLGLEVFRILAMGLLVFRASDLKFAERLRLTLYKWLLFVPGPMMFVIWRFFIFESARKATDFGAQVGQFFTSPLLIGMNWVVALLKNSVEAMFFVWGVPIANLWDTPLRLRELFIAGLFVLMAAALIAVLIRFSGKDENLDPKWHLEALWIGLICVVTGLIPVILSNREADFGNYSRYFLPSSSGAAIFLVGGLSQFNSRGLRNAAIFFLVGSSVLTHYINGLQWSRSSQAMNDFWWQVSWRIPQLEKKTTLVVNYSQIALEEDYFIWGPANLIYRPQSMDNENLLPALWGMVLTPDGVRSILSGAEPEAINRRSILTYMGYDNILVLSQPTSKSCVQVIDGNLPFVSEAEEYEIREIKTKSDLRNIVVSDSQMIPPRIVFGPEPGRTWCYYYETASLALQKGDYRTVLNLKKQAEKQGFSASDPVEWMPFLEAAILQQEPQEVLEMARLVKKSTTLQEQACQNFSGLPGIDPEMEKMVRQTFCVKE